MLDAGTGIRNLPRDLGRPGGHIHILLTHLHMDHIQWGCCSSRRSFDPRTVELASEGAEVEVG